MNFLMEGKHNVWNPWYLMPKDKLGLVKCKFYDNVISYHKDTMFFYLGYQYDGNGQTWVTVCSRAQPWVKALFVQCGGLVLWPLKNKEVLTHFLDGRTKDMAIEMLNPSMEGESALKSQVERVCIYTLLTYNTEGLNRSTNNNIQTFQ